MITEDQKNILRIVAQWLSAAGTPNNADQRLTIERVGFGKTEGGDVTHVQYVISANIVLATPIIPITQISKPETLTKSNGEAQAVRETPVATEPKTESAQTPS